MPEIKNNFIQGKMNKDLDDRLLPNGQYRDGFNIRISKSENSDVGTVQNIKGNNYASGSPTLSLPRTYHPNNSTGGGDPLLDTIGYYADSLEGYIFWFVTSFAGSTSDDILNTTYATPVSVAGSDVNHDDDSAPNTTITISNATKYGAILPGMKVTGTGVVSDTFVQAVSISGNTATVHLNKIQSGQTVLDGVALTFTHTCRIYYMNTKTNVQPTILIDNPKLNFSKNHHIHHVNLINNLLFWTDNYNQPRRINIDLAIAGATYINNEFFEDKISVAQYMPYSAPKVKMENITGSVILGNTALSVVTTNRTGLTNGTHSVTVGEDSVTTSGAGEDLSLDIIVSGQTVTGVKVTSEGTGFVAGDTITLPTSLDWIPIGLNSGSVILTLRGSELVENSRHIQDKFVKFGYRFQYENNEYSIISPFTQTCFMPGKGKVMNKGSYLDGQAGMLSVTDATDAFKNTTVESMQNAVNRVHLFIDLPTETTINSIAAADAGPSVVTPNSHLKGLSNTIHGVHQDDATNNPIANGDKLLTQRGDEYIVNSFTSANPNSTLVTTKRIKPSIVAGERLYFFDAPAAYTNPLNIKKIEIVYVESNSLAVKVVETISLNNTTSYSHRVEPITSTKGRLIYGYSYIYDSAKPIKTLPSKEITRVMDSVPIKANAQEMSGNRIIYGNFKQNRPLSQAITPNSFSVDSGNQSNINNSYLLSSVKSVREYSVGLVLSDRYGRQSTVFLPSVSTTFVRPQDTNSSGTPGVSPGGTWSLDDIWTHAVLKLQFSSTIQDVYNHETNPLGWYSYKVVVKQPEQEYYNVYAPNLIDNIPSSNPKSWLVLYGDNINKVPRDVTDVNIETGLAGSNVELLPKMQFTGSAYTHNPNNDYIDVISIGKASEHNATVSNFTSATGDQLIPDLYKSITDPLVAELPDGLGFNYSGGAAAFGQLVTLETKPVTSALDIYFESSTAGLISDLNESILGATGALPSQINITSATFTEFQGSGTTIGSLSANDSAGNQLSNETYALVQVFDGGGNNRTSEFVITGSNLKTATTFTHTNRPSDDFTVTIQVTDNSGNTFNENISIELLNVAPTIMDGTGSMNLGASTPSGTQVRTIVAVNGSANSGSNNSGLSFSITGGTGTNKFSINSFTGVISTTASLGSTGTSYSLQITVEDSGGLQDVETLNITLVTATRTSFYRSFLGRSTASAACQESTSSQVYHDGSGILPANGDKVYTSATGTTVFNSQTLYHSMTQDPAGIGGQKSRFRTNALGVVSDVSTC